MMRPALLLTKILIPKDDCIKVHFNFRNQFHNFITHKFMVYTYIIIITNLSNNRSKASSKTIPPHSAIYSFLLQLTVSSPVLKVIQ